MTDLGRRSAAPATTLSVENLAKSYSGRTVFSDLNLQVAPGLTAVTGKNGSGKTTLLKILAGLLRPSAGHVRLECEGQALAPSQRRLAIGWAGPDLALYGELTALENLAFFRRAAGRPAPSEELTRRLTEVGLASEAIGRRVEEFSTGMKQRLRIAFAALFDPPILLLDEPMAGLDIEGRETVHRAVEAARQRGAVVLASNDERDFLEAQQRIELGATGRREAAGGRQEP
jgi:heme exporter protein A